MRPKSSFCYYFQCTVFVFEITKKYMSSNLDCHLKTQVKCQLFPVNHLDRKSKEPRAKKNKAVCPRKYTWQSGFSSDLLPLDMSLHVLTTLKRLMFLFWAPAIAGHACVICTENWWCCLLVSPPGQRMPLFWCRDFCMALCSRTFVPLERAQS